MKKVYSNLFLLKASFIFGTTLLTGSMYPIAVYLENNYGETLNYKTSSTDPEGKNIGTNVRVLLGDINSVTGLWIRTTSIISSYFSSYYDFTRFIDDIRSQQRQHSNDDAIIAIDRTGTKQWNPNFRWEAKGKSIILFDPLTGAPKVQPIGQPLTQPAVTIEIDLEQLEKEEALMATTAADGRLDHIKNGALGSDYARKATEICSANYTQAEKLGKINLCSRLKAEIVAPKALRLSEPISPLPESLSLKINPKTKNPNKPRRTENEILKTFRELAPAIEDIKNSINRIHNALGGYKTRGEAS